MFGIGHVDQGVCIVSVVAPVCHHGLLGERRGPASVFRLCLCHLLSSVAWGVLGAREVQGLVPDGRVEHRFHEVRQALRRQEVPPGN